MTYIVFISSALITYGPATALFALIIANSAQLTILAIGSMFFWMLSALITSMLWAAVPPLKHIFPVVVGVGVILQELMRFGFWKLYSKAYAKVAAMGDNSKPSDFFSALTIGWGYGVSSSLILYTSLMWASMGQGDYPTPACPQLSYFHVGAMTQQAFIALHILLNIIAFEGYKRWSWWKIAVPPLAHAAASYLTLLNEHGGSCIGALAGIYAIVVLMVLLVGKILLGTNNVLLSRKPVVGSLNED